MDAKLNGSKPRSPGNVLSRSAGRRKKGREADISTSTSTNDDDDDDDWYNRSGSKMSLLTDDDDVVVTSNGSMSPAVRSGEFCGYSPSGSNICLFCCAVEDESAMNASAFRAIMLAMS